MKRFLKLATKLLLRSKKTIVLVLIVVIATVVIYTLIEHNVIVVSKKRILSLGTIKTLGVEAYWDKNLKTKTETIEWGTISPGSSENITLYLRSISNTEATLLLNTTNWKPSNISEYVNLSWNYNGTILHSGETIQVTLTLTTSSSDTFIVYLLTNVVKEFSFDIVISTSEQ